MALLPVHASSASRLKSPCIIIIILVKCHTTTNNINNNNNTKKNNNNVYIVNGFKMEEYYNWKTKNERVKLFKISHVMMKIRYMSRWIDRSLTEELNLIDNLNVIEISWMCHRPFLNLLKIFVFVNTINHFHYWTADCCLMLRNDDDVIHWMVISIKE